MKTGPKIIMIGKMMVDFVLFLFLIVIFLLTYGICSQVNRLPAAEVIKVISVI